MHNIRTVGSLGASFLLFASAAAATPVTVDDPFYFREFRSANDTGSDFGDRLIYGANSVVPNGDSGTTATRMFGTTGGLANLPFNPRSTNPNQFSGSTDYSLARAIRDANLVFTNGLDSTSVSVAAVGDIGRMPFARGLSMSGTGTALSFSWTNPTSLPTGVTLERAQIRVFDLERFNAVGNADVVHTALLSSPTTTTYALPGSLSSGLTLELGHHYAVSVRLEDLRPGVDPGLGAPARLSSSEAYFNFTPTSAALPPNIYLPQHASGSPFVFDVPVEPGKVFNVDPPIAIGYDYATAAGNPNFQSIILPTGIGDNAYQLLLWDGSAFSIDGGTLTGGIQHLFAGGGVNRFRILGIETSASLDPSDPLAFVTGLTFAAEGDFTGSMTAITVNVPEPETYALMLAGLVVVGFGARKHRRA